MGKFKDCLRQARLYLAAAMQNVSPKDVRYKRLNDLIGEIEEMIMEREL